MLADVFHPDQVRQYIRETLEKTKGCRMEQWARIAREEIERAAG
jgi:hypothetical protein